MNVSIYTLNFPIKNVNIFFLAVKWFKRRKILTPAFHFKILDQFVDIFDQQANQLIKTLSKFKPDEKVELYPLVTLYALDVICGNILKITIYIRLTKNDPIEAAMGVSVNAQLQSNSDYVKAVKT